MKQKNIAIMYALALLQGMVFYTPIATLYRQAQGVSVFQITIIESFSLILCLLLFLGGVGFLSEVHQTFTVFFNQLQYVRCGLSSSMIGYIYIGVTIAGLCGVFSSRVTQKHGIAKTAELLYTAAVAACLLLAFTGSAWLSVAAILVLRVAYSLFQPLQTEIQNKQIQTANRATALSINAILIESVGVSTNVVFGALAERSLPLRLSARQCIVRRRRRAVRPLAPLWSPNVIPDDPLYMACIICYNKTRSKSSA